MTQIGMSAKKDEEFNEWYTQVLRKADLIDYTPVSGCYVIKPNAMFVWEQIQKWFDREIAKLGVRNAYFPLFIPESLLKKEATHVEGFAPEVAWVTHGGQSKLAERLAVRPTSETIMYDSFSKWIQSHKELPLRLNQWCNVVRWEFKHPTPFLRTREFLWQEGHTVHATKESADQEVRAILDLYEKVFVDLLAVPILKGIKSEDEKFAGALYSTSCEAIMPHGKAVQACTSHCLGQNFAKAFNITFLNEKGESSFAWQNSWGISTRSIGIMIMMHGDNKGAVLPPRVAWQQAVIVPIYQDKNKEDVLAEARKLSQRLTVRAAVDDRDDYTPGWKFNDWEMRGIPVRIELGPKDLEKKQAVLVRRDTGEKKIVGLDQVSAQVTQLLEQIQTDMLERARAKTETLIVEAAQASDLEKTEGKVIRASWCAKAGCHEKIKEASEGMKCLTLAFDAKPSPHCFMCRAPATCVGYFGRSY